MDVTTDTREDGIVMIRPAGRLDLMSANEVRNGLNAAVTAGHHRLIVDLELVTFIDSSGLGALISGLKSARLAGGDLRIARPGVQARYLLQLTMLDRVLHPYPTVEEAVAGY